MTLNVRLTKNMNENNTDDPDRDEIDRLYPAHIKVGDPFEMTSGLMKGKGTCIRRKLTSRGGVLLTIQFDDGTIKEWEWFD